MNGISQYDEGIKVLFFNASEIFQTGLLQTNYNKFNHGLLFILRQTANNMWHQLNTTKYLNTVVLPCAYGRSTCRMVLNSRIPSMSSEHCGALHSSTIAHIRNLSSSSISINITSYFFSSPPIPCSCFAKCDCKSSLQFFQ